MEYRPAKLQACVSSRRSRAVLRLSNLSSCGWKRSNVKVQSCFAEVFFFGWGCSEATLTWAGGPAHSHQREVSSVLSSALALSPPLGRTFPFTPVPTISMSQTSRGAFNAFQVYFVVLFSDSLTSTGAENTAPQHRWLFPLQSLHGARSHILSVHGAEEASGNICGQAVALLGVSTPLSESLKVNQEGSIH